MHPVRFRPFTGSPLEHRNPTVAHLTGFDIYRDGGSLGAFFNAGANARYELHFPIRLSASETDECAVLGYGTPRLVRSWQAERVSHVTGLSSFDWCHQEQVISWERARRILACIRQKANMPLPPESRVFEDMFDIAHSSAKQLRETSMRMVSTTRAETYTWEETAELCAQLREVPGVLCISDIKQHPKGGYIVSVQTTQELAESFAQHVLQYGWRLVI
jgi:hypothetical protein